MALGDEGPAHPGARIKAEVIPAGMSVTEAAKLLGVGRPALSNLLNGNASLSTDMAARLSKAFGYALKDLVEMQSSFDAAMAKRDEASAGARTYVPPFLGFTANHIVAWIDQNIRARIRFSVLLRTLVHSTGADLTKVDFPGNDDAERPGWDGYVEANKGTPWVPTGLSGWEFGVTADVKSKADSDFAKSVKALDKKERARITFVFVTPQRWPGKSAWVNAKKALKHWKDVRAYDASDLEQWLEQSLPGQVWFANETHAPSQDVSSLDKCWEDWASVANPALSGALFTSAIEANRRSMLSQLSKAPERPIIIAADSRDEALAFLAQLFGERGGQELSSYRDRVIVFDKAGIFPRLAAGAQTFIPVACSPDVERELAAHTRTMHSIVVRPRNAAVSEPDIVLEPASYDVFDRALEEMGKDRDAITRLSKASGRSLTVLRRQLSDVDAVRTPAWAADRHTAESLVPFLFVGAWNSHNETDRTGLSLLAGGKPYAELEKECQALTKLNDAPLWSVGGFRGAISKIDLLYAIAGVMTSDDLKRYFSMARMVLGEDDPALDLAEDQRWAAAVHGKTREFSVAFREGISETLVLLAVHGNELFKGRIGFDAEAEATLLVRDLLTPLSTRILQAKDRDLPIYAEAAPDEFLSILERDLRSSDPVVFGLLRPVSPDVFGGSPSRTGLLWALEGLSWSPATLPRAAMILARLAQIEITDNWVNKPINSLESIFRAWMPQTAAGHDQRVALMKRLADKFPDVAWRLCIEQFGSQHRVGDYSHKPRWRPDGYGFGEPLPTWGPIHAFVRVMVEMALSWKKHSFRMLCDLVERLHDLAGSDQDRVWALIEVWAKTEANDADKAAMREKIRVSTLSRRAAIRAKKAGAGTKGLVAAGKAAYDALEPTDLLNKHAWLFRDSWVNESADEIEDIEKIDFSEREERIRKLRSEALADVIRHLGVAGVISLSRLGRASWFIGSLTANLLNDSEIEELLSLAFAPILAGVEDVQSLRGLIGGVLHGVDEERRERLLMELAADLSEEGFAQLLLLAPFGRSTWKLVDVLNEAAQSRYWSEVGPNWIHKSEAENQEAVERLLKWQRPRAAFSCARFRESKLDIMVLHQLLTALAQGGDEKHGEYMLEQYHICEAFKQLNASSEVSLEQKASLEFAFIDALARPWEKRNGGGIPNLERYIEANPELFIQAVVWCYRRGDGAADPAEYQVSEDRKASLAERGYKLLEAIQRTPGHDDLGELQADRLAKWVAIVRRTCAELDRAEVADICIGKVLSYASVGKDGIWPCEPVRDVMEDIQSEEMARGARTGIYNARGVHWRGEGGDQERELAQKYRKWGEALQVSHPFVSAHLLIDMAKTYEHEASREDTEAGIRRRLR